MSTKKKTTAAKPAAKKATKGGTRSVASAPTTPAQPEKKLSLLSAALEVLKSDDAALTTKQMVEQAKARNLWTPGAGKTPVQTLYSAILREIKAKGESSRFVKSARGLFAIRRA